MGQVLGFKIGDLDMTGMPWRQKKACFFEAGLIVYSIIMYEVICFHGLEQQFYHP